MRIRVGSSNTMNRLRWIVVMSVPAFAALIGTPSTSLSVEPSNPWEKGNYRDFTPQTLKAKAPSGVTARSIGPVLKLERTAVQHSRLSPGDPASLLAQYDVAGATGTVKVTETRVIEFNGTVLTKLIKTIPRPNGSVGSEYQLRIPQDAAEGWYTVRTIVENAGVITRSVATEHADAAFYIEATGTGAPMLGNERPRKENESPRVGADEGVKIKLSADKPRYKVGDTITLHFETNRDGYLTLVNVGTSGKITILFPNRFSGGQEVKGKKLYTIPEPDDNYELALSGPAGHELIYALVTSKPVKFVETDFSQTPQIFQSVTENAGTFTRDINAVVKKTPLKEQAKAAIEMEVVP